MAGKCGQAGAAAGDTAALIGADVMDSHQLITTIYTSSSSYKQEYSRERVYVQGNIGSVNVSP